MVTTEKWISRTIINAFNNGNKQRGRPFKKGNIPWNKDLKGIHLSLKSEIKKGDHISVMTEFKVGQTSPRKGIKSPGWRNGTSFTKGNKPWNKGIKLPELSGPNHRYWRGDKVKYGALHSWLSRVLGKASECKLCGVKDSKRYEWANISRKYRRDLDDWMSLCAKCHRNYDREYMVYAN